jgi:hypothetical protein
MSQYAMRKVNIPAPFGCHNQTDPLPPSRLIRKREWPNLILVAYIRAMGHIDTCLGILRRLIAKGDINGIPLAERAINEYWDATSAQVRKSGLRFLQQDVLDHRERLYRKEAGKLIRTYLAAGSLRVTIKPTAATAAARSEAACKKNRMSSSCENGFAHPAYEKIVVTKSMMREPMSPHLKESLDTRSPLLPVRPPQLAALKIAPYDYGYRSLPLNLGPFRGDLELPGFKDPTT